MMSDKVEHLNEACRLARARGSLRAIADMLPGLLGQIGRPELGLSLSTRLAEALAAPEDQHMPAHATDAPELTTPSHERTTLHGMPRS